MTYPVATVTIGVWVSSIVGISRLTCQRSWRWVVPARGLLSLWPRVPEIEAGAEVVTRARQRDDADRLVAAGGLDRLDERKDDVVGDRVAPVGPVEPEAEDRAVGLDHQTVRRGRVGLHAFSICSNRVDERGQRVGAGGRATRRVGESHLAAVAAGQQDRGVAGRRRLAPLVLTPDVELDRGPIAVGEQLARDATTHPVRVADVVELPELAVELPQPRVVAHPVGAEVDQPGLAHPAVVVARGVARPCAPTRDPSARAAARRGR